MAYKGYYAQAHHRAEGIMFSSCLSVCACVRTYLLLLSLDHHAKGMMVQQVDPVTRRVRWSRALSSRLYYALIGCSETRSTNPIYHQRQAGTKRSDVAACMFLTAQQNITPFNAAKIWTRPVVINSNNMKTSNQLHSANRKSK